MPAKSKEPQISSTSKESQAKLAITAARDLSAIRENRCVEMFGRSRLSENATILANRHASQQLLGSSACKAGFAVDEFEKIRARNQADLRRFAGEKRAEAIKCAAARQHALIESIDYRRKGLGVLQATPPSPFYVTLEKPFLIWATHPYLLGDTHVEPWNSWAKFKFDSGSTYGAEQFTFYYLWENPSDRYAVVNIDGYIIVNGHCQVGQDGGNFPGDRFASVALTAQLFPLEWWNQPPTSPLQQADQTQLAFSLRTQEPAGFFDPGEIDAANAFRGCDVRYSLFVLPPHGVTVIEVALTASWGTGTDGGHVFLDFDTGDFKVMSPFVLIAVLT